MIHGLTLLAVILMQQGDTTTGLSPRARAMLHRFPPPVGRDVAIDARFSEDTVWIGSQVELVTAAWFPRDLRDRLRRPPTLRAPALSGLWSAPDQDDPELAETRRVAGRVYDLFISHQTLFPLGAGSIEAPSAVLSYAVPASSSFFAPEDRKTISSRPVRLVVREIPAGLAARLGSGPTARAISLGWRVPAQGITAGVPATVELVLNGIGNVTLWPTPEIVWPGGIRIYPEPTEESVIRPNGIVRGEKRFRYTIVADSVGVITLPRVRYPHFDPIRVQVRISAAAARGLVVRPAGLVGSRPEVASGRQLSNPLIPKLVAGWWPLLILLALLPLARLGLLRRPRPAPFTVPDSAPISELRRLLGPVAASTPSGVEEALRRRGVAAPEALAVRGCLESRERNRWAREGGEPPDETPIKSVVARLKGQRSTGALAFVLLMIVPVGVGAQWDKAVASLDSGDALVAEALFADQADLHPLSPEPWLNLGASRWLAGDDVGSVAAWLQGAQVAPRDARLHGALAGVATLPADLRSRVPTVPLNRHELTLIALAAWLVGWLCWRRRRTFSQLAFALMILAGGTALSRTITAGERTGLVRQGAVLRVSPLPGAPVVGTAPEWSIARIEVRQDSWYLVRIGDSRRGWLPVNRVASLSGVD